MEDLMHSYRMIKLKEVKLKKNILKGTTCSRVHDVWEWVGFSTKGNAKKMLVKHFEKNIDFMEEDISLIQLVKQPVHGGQNNETIMLSVNTFKKFCMKASTKRADQICDYYVKMENIMMEYIQNKHFF